jgi:uncharacterized protein YkwD
MGTRSQSAIRSILALGILAPGVVSASAAVKAQSFDASGARAVIVNETNAYRRQKGLAPLGQNAGASRVAQAYAAYLARTNKTGHHADGRSPPGRLRAAGVTFCKFQGENWHLSWTRPKRASVGTAASKAMRFWKKSPGHERALRSRSTEIGVGVAGWRHGNKWYYVEVQMFIDTSCLGPARLAPSDDALPPLPERKPVPPLPDRNPAKLA